MNGKMHSETGAFSSDDMRAEILNPFVHKLELDNTYDKIKTAIFTVILLPFRVIVILYLIVTAWFLACIGLYGLSEEDLRRKPMTGWRSKLRFSILSLMRLVPVVAGFHRVRILGAQADRREAPVIVMAPHSSFFDAIAIVCLGAPSVVAKADTARLPFIGRMFVGCAVCVARLYPVAIRALKPLICFIGKMSYLAGGMAISVRGRQASRQEAPILVVAPHSSFLDSCIVYATRMSSVIVRKESMDNYVGKLINYTQPVYVWRDDPNSRANTIKEIIQRATSKEDWPQILIFPEGTCTNRSCLITFKSGGFYPGVPVQPVTIRYPNARDTVTWTWEGPGALKLLWLTLTQVHSSCEIEFLPVYYPSEEERRDPKLYARNVRDVMANGFPVHTVTERSFPAETALKFTALSRCFRALGVPVLDYTYDDCRLIARAKRLGIPAAASVREVAELRTQLGLERSQLELHLIAQGLARRARWVAPEELARRLGVPAQAPAAQRLAQVFTQPSSGLVCVPDYLLCAAFLSLQQAPLAQLLSLAFKLYDNTGTGRVNAATFEEIAGRCLGLCQEDAHNTFGQADQDEKGWLTYDEFISFAQKKPELSFVFSSETASKPKSQ